jgi:hypothetical protein
MRAGGSGVPLTQRTYLSHELSDVLEGPVDRSEAYVGYRIQLPKFSHHGLTDDAARYLAGSLLLDSARDGVGNGLDGVDADGSLLAGPLESRDDLGSIVGLSPAVLLHDER